MALPFEAKDLSPELSNYVHAYISAWLKEDSWPQDEENKAKLKAIHDAWSFYLSRGFFGTEEFYGAFLEKNGMEQFPAFLRLMDSLQGPKNCIFQTDDDPRCVPFPPAFQAAVLKWAKSGICAQDESGLEAAAAIFAAMKDVGMHRLHQSSLQGDYHDMSIAEWMEFFKSLEDDASERDWGKRLENKEGLALIRTWLAIDSELAEVRYANAWEFTPENELRKKTLPYPHDVWHHFFRGFSVASFMRCLETTGAEHLKSLLVIGYAVNPYKFHYSLQYGDRYDVFVTPAFEQAIEQFLEHTSRPDKEKQLEYVGKALAFLARTGVKEFESGFDVGCWADILCRDKKERAVEDNGSCSPMSDEKGAVSEDGGFLSQVKMFFKDGWLAMKHSSTPHLRALLGIDYDSRHGGDNHCASEKHYPAPSEPELPGFFKFFFGALCSAPLFAQFPWNNKEVSNWTFLWFLGGIAMLNLAPFICGFLYKYMAFCRFARWRKETFSCRIQADELREKTVRNEVGDWHFAMTGSRFDRKEGAAMEYAAKEMENLSYAWDWIGPILAYYGDSDLYNELDRSLHRAMQYTIPKCIKNPSLRLSPRTPPTPIEEEISLEDLIAESHGKCPH